MKCDISEQQDSVALTRSERSDLGSKRSSFLDFELPSSLFLLFFFFFSPSKHSNEGWISHKKQLPAIGTARTAHGASADRRSPNPPKPHILLPPSSLPFPSSPRHPSLDFGFRSSFPFPHYLPLNSPRAISRSPAAMDMNHLIGSVVCSSRAGTGLMWLGCS